MTETKSELTPELLQHIEAIITKYRYDQSRLLEILLEIQQAVPLHYLPRPAAYAVAERLHLPPTQVFDVISFFSALHESPRAKYPIQVCSSIACQISHGGGLLPMLQEILGIEPGRATYDGRFCLEEVPCFGACDRAPAIRIHQTVYGPITRREQVEEILRGLE